jgi:hypothetical protein
MQWRRRCHDRRTTPQRLSDAIDELVKRRLDEGELNECPLTLTDLTKIKAAFLSVLVGIYHTRVRYPEAPKPRLRRPRQKAVPPPPEDTLPEAESLQGGDHA